MNKFFMEYCTKDVEIGNCGHIGLAAFKRSRLGTRTDKNAGQAEMGAAHDR